MENLYPSNSMFSEALCCAIVPVGIFPLAWFMVKFSPPMFLTEMF